MTDVLDTLKKLPERCLAKHPTDGSTILIQRGVAGYWPFPGRDVDAYNARHGITPALVEAMQIGSMFGWDVPGADPDAWDKPLS